MKVSIIGSGAVGSTTAFSLAKTDYIDELSLVDLDQKRAKGNALDILHGLSLSHAVKINYGDYEQTANSDIIVITVGVPEKVGESRLVPLQRNATILQAIIPKITHYSPKGIILMVSNPVDILTYFAYKISGWPAQRVIGLGTMLDTARLNWLLSRDYGVAQTAVHGLIIGEHGDSQVVAWSQTSVAGTQFDTYVAGNKLTLATDYKATIAQQVKDTAFDVWKMKGPNAFCVALAIERVIQAIVRDEQAILPVSRPASKEGDCYISQPAVIGRQGAVRTVPLQLTSSEQAQFTSSLQAVETVAAQIEL
ncbi:L-lactate dehydrogenase [Loigolactobacillus binensis]|uniref:L-lactate dehydrogenase n=1 Tax=Loigolactobacillus binensis TaxID=2559922 RepID=A0ABW3EA14_9LACO|nr:L-lactate dehydrogenase [Loigolactobacillus binensis]